MIDAPLKRRRLRNAFGSFQNLILGFGDAFTQLVDPGLFSKEISNCLVVTVVFEKRLVRANHFCILGKPLANARAKTDDPLDALSRKKRITKYLLGPLSDAVHAAGTLHQSNDCPWQVIVHNNETVLQVLAFAEDIGG